MLLWSMTEDDVVAGLRKRGLPVQSNDDLTSHEIEYIREYADMVSDTAARELIDVLAVRIRRERGWNE